MVMLSTQNAIKLAVVVTYFVVSISIEIFYREPFFNYSLTFEEKVQANLPKWFKDYLTFVTDFGVEKYLVPILTVIALFVPLSKILSIIISMFSAIYLDNIMKLIYHDPRPYWENPNLNDNVHCDLGFGNPSGHSFVSSATYLSIWYVLTDYSFFKEKVVGKVIKWILCVLCFLFVFSIMFSRIYLGVHSLDQIVYGCNMGVGTFLLYFWVFKIGSLKPKEFFTFYDKAKFYLHTIFILFFSASVILYFTVENPNIKEYRETIIRVCGEEKIKEYRLFNNDGMYGSTSIFVLIGGLLGYSFLKHFVDKNYPGEEDLIINWQSEKIARRAIRIIIGAAFAAPILLTKLIDEKKSKLIIFLFRCIVPYLVVSFLFIGPGILIGYMLANKVSPPPVIPDSALLDGSKEILPKSDDNPTISTI